MLRQDDADSRLTRKSYEIGLARKERVDLLAQKEDEINRLREFTSTFSIKPALINPFLETQGTSPLREGCKLVDLVNRPQLSFDSLRQAIPALQETIDKIPNRREEIVEAAEIQIKYSGYITREQQIADKLTRLENIKIKGKFDYMSIKTISTEARQKLTRIDPETIGQASRISGISPSDINILLVLLGR